MIGKDDEQSTHFILPAILSAANFIFFVYIFPLIQFPLTL